ncbi:MULTISPECIES: AprI/Inh family metalloprotease inhibitor [unclassified Devosia]|uniref:AprI/Inh family metalloprotease inhibitor n=1 Tax=unclassified Devosia TaxID=196773 RepID=UPI00145D46E8|nr:MULTISPECIES: AprI/Inh family metalloprotease inhibitor [unclassified Devosia]MBJ6987611.1 AprI/Inh family metalloprotease inhibitor [Devosia sp. MC521]MBK1794077.1 AprI/Inh family metalloprotease inhibitor [Devosia sp. WQ 349K1]QMW61962.1 AprI/Inh family metalloprotease inhibitor [Devosia sp. MC521]
MQVWTRSVSTLTSLAVMALVVAACSPTSRTNTANLNVVGTPQQLQPVQTSAVQTNSLPPLGGVSGTVAPGLSGQPVLGGQQTSALPPLGGTSNTFATAGTTGGSFASVPTASGPEGSWNVAAAGQACQLNLPLTSKTGTSYYRASAPGCGIPQVAAITGWQQVGSQLQLYDENGNIAAFLAPSSGRYIGTMSGGQALSMSR